MSFVRYRTKKKFLLELEGKTLKIEIHCLPLDAFLSVGTERPQQLRMYAAIFIPVTNIY